MNISASELFIEVSCKQQNCARERVCGDTFLYKRLLVGGRVLIVLSDGMGHGVKANILSNITASMITNLNIEELDVEKMSQMILKSLPRCEIRGVSYSTFSIVDINPHEGVATIIEYDNPKRLLFRGDKKLQTIEDILPIKSAGRKQLINVSRTDIKDGDRIILMTDGVTQSGMGKKYPFGWGRDRVYSFAQNKIMENSDISSSELATMVVDTAINNDSGLTHDDVSCAVITIRRPKRTLICASIPSTDVDDEYLDIINSFNGERIICGYYLATTIANRSGKEIIKSSLECCGTQQMWEMEGVSLICESLITLSKANEILLERKINTTCEDIATRFANTLLDSDEIDFIIGKARDKGWVYKINDYDLRHNILLSVINTLKNKYNKEINITYI